MFCGLLLNVLGSRGVFHDWWTTGRNYRSIINTCSFGRSRPISWAKAHVFGVPKQFPRLMNLGVRLRFGHQHSSFWLILARFLGFCSLFWAPECFWQLMKHMVQLWVDHQPLLFLLILAYFVGYCSQFWGPRAYSTIDEPWGVLIGQSPTLAVLANSGQFRGLLLTILVSQSVFHDWWT